MFKLIPGAPGDFVSINEIPRAEDWGDAKRIEEIKSKLRVFNRREFQTSAIQADKDKARAELEAKGLEPEDEEAQIDQAFAALIRELLAADDENRPVDTRMGRLAWRCIFGCDAEPRAARTANRRAHGHRTARRQPQQLSGANGLSGVVARELSGWLRSTAGRTSAARTWFTAARSNAEVRAMGSGSSSPARCSRSRTNRAIASLRMIIESFPKICSYDRYFTKIVESSVEWLAGGQAADRGSRAAGCERARCP